jgi:hypothetical protein
MDAKNSLKTRQKKRIKIKRENGITFLKKIMDFVPLFFILSKQLPNGSFFYGIICLVQLHSRVGG